MKFHSLNSIFILLLVEKMVLSQPTVKSNSSEPLFKISGNMKATPRKKKTKKTHHFKSVKAPTIKLPPVPIQQFPPMDVPTPISSAPVTVPVPIKAPSTEPSPVPISSAPVPVPVPIKAPSTEPSPVPISSAPVPVPVPVSDTPKPTTRAPVPTTSAPLMPAPVPTAPTPDPLDNFSLIISSDPQYAWYDKRYPQGLDFIKECNVKTNKNRNCVLPDGSFEIRNCLDSAPCNNNRDENPMKRNSERMIRQQYNSMTNLKSKRNVQGVIINGDLTNLGKDWQWTKAQELIKILSDASLRVFPSLGNHDYDITDNLRFTGALPDATRMVNAMTDWLDNQWNSNSKVVLSKAPMVNEAKKFCGSMAYSFNIEKIHVLQLQFYPSFTASQQPCDTKRNPQCQPTDWIDGTKSYSITTSWDFMVNDLAKARNRGDIILVFLHSYNSIKGMSSSDTKKFDDIMTKYGVSALFAGHVHESFGKIASSSIVPFFRSGASSFQVYLVADIDVASNKMKIWLSEDTKSLNTDITDETVGLIDENAALFPAGQYNSEPLVTEAKNFWDVVLIDTKPTIPEIVPELPELTC